MSYIINFYQRASLTEGVLMGLLLFCLVMFVITMLEGDES